MARRNSDTLKVGNLAPDFTLPSSDGNDITLSAYRGAAPLILYFFRGTW